MSHDLTRWQLRTAQNQTASPSGQIPPRDRMQDGNAMANSIGNALRLMNQAALDEPVPREFADLMARIDQADQRGNRP